MNYFFEEGKYKYFLTVAAAAVMTVIPFYNILMKVYNWHIRQPEFIEGGLEAVIFILLLTAACRIFKASNFTLILFGGALYLSMNGVLIPFVINYLYFEMLMYIGAVCLSIKKSDSTLNGDLIKSLIAGIAVWISGAVLCSLCGFGTIEFLRIYSAVLFLLSLIAAKRKKHTFLFERYSKYLERFNKKSFSIFLELIIIFVILVLYAKTNTAQDFDSLWYGLRPEEVLIGDNSFYDNLGFGSFVYYYPKLMELLYLPMSDMGDYSILQGANVFILIFTTIVVDCLIKKLCVKISEKQELFSILLVISIPAAANIAATAKPDILGNFFVLSSIIYFFDFWKWKNTDDFAFGFISLVLSTGTKLTYLLWGGVLFAVVLCFAVFDLVKKDRTIAEFHMLPKEMILCLVSLFSAAGIHYRTLKLTGFPIYPIFIDLFQKLGFSAKKYALQVHIAPQNQMTVKNIIKRVYQFIFNPSDLEHVIMLWTSSLVFFLMLIALLNIKGIIKILRKSNKEDRFAAVLSVSYVFVMLYYMCSMKVPDGNYFILPIIMISAFIIKLIYLLYGREREYHGTFVTCACLFLALQLPVFFVSHSSWSYGTKAFSKEIITNNFETKDTNEMIFNQNRFSVISKYLSQFHGNTKERFLASGHNSGACFRLPCAVETAEEFDKYFSNEKILKSFEQFKSYVQSINLKGFILFRDDVSVYAQYVKEYTTNYNCTQIIEDEAAIYYELR